MDILNFISWIKAGNYRATLPTDVVNLIPVGAKDPSRDDSYLPLAINAAPLQSLYNTGNVTQTGSITNSVTVNALNGVITTVSATTSGNSTEAGVITVGNSLVTTTSKILLSCEYTGAANGIPVALIASVANGQFTIKLSNGGLTALNAPVRIHYMIIA